MSVESRNQFSSVTQSCLTVTPWTAACRASLSITNTQSLLKLMSIATVMLSKPLTLVMPLSCHLQSFPESGSFPMSWFFTSGGYRIGVSASASVLLMNIQDWFPLGLTGLISLQSKGLSRVKEYIMFKWLAIKRFPWWLSGKETTYNVEAANDVGLIPELERAPGEGNGNPPQYSCVENPIDRRTWQAMVHRVAKSQTQLKRLSLLASN